MPKYIVEFSLKHSEALRDPDKVYANGKIPITTDHDIDTMEDVNEINKQLFRQFREQPDYADIQELILHNIYIAPQEPEEINPEDFDGEVVPGEVINE